MSPPVVKNVCKSAREEEGFKSFGQWYDGENNIYIGRNAAKYAQRGVYDSKWANPFTCLDWSVSKEEWLLEDLVKCYENYVRKNPELMNSLHELEGKQLGCWCKPGPCNGDVPSNCIRKNMSNNHLRRRGKPCFDTFLYNCIFVVNCT